MTVHEKYSAFSRPSIKAAFSPYLDRLLQSIASEEWLDAQVDLIALAKLVQKHQLDEKLRESAAMANADQDAR
jgi:hypothetical protein